MNKRYKIASALDSQWQRLYVWPPLFDRKSIELFAAMYCGFSWANSRSPRLENELRARRWRSLPFTESHRVVIVGSHSGREIVKPGIGLEIVLGP